MRRLTFTGDELHDFRQRLARRSYLLFFTMRRAKPHARFHPRRFDTAVAR
jgi:hypothetical protein